MIYVNIDQEMIEKAKQEASKMPVLKNSIKNGKGNVAGILGELAFVKHFPEADRNYNCYDYDLNFKGRKLEIKTQIRKQNPQPWFDIVVSNFNTKQAADFYVFVCMIAEDENYKSAWIVGYYNKETFFKDAQFILKGQSIKQGQKEFIAKSDCYRMTINKLIPFKT